MINEIALQAYRVDRDETPHRHDSGTPPRHTNMRLLAIEVRASWTTYFSTKNEKDLQSNYISTVQATYTQWTNFYITDTIVMGIKDPKSDWRRYWRILNPANDNSLQPLRLAP